MAAPIFQHCDLKKIKSDRDLHRILSNYCLLRDYIMLVLYPTPFLLRVNKLMLSLENSLLVIYFQILSTRVFKS